MCHVNSCHFSPDKPLCIVSLMSTHIFNLFSWTCLAFHAIQWGYVSILSFQYISKKWRHFFYIWEVSISGCQYRFCDTYMTFSCIGCLVTGNFLKISRFEIMKSRKISDYRIHHFPAVVQCGYKSRISNMKYRSIDIDTLCFPLFRTDTSVSIPTWRWFLRVLYRNVFSRAVLFLNFYLIFFKPSMLGFHK